MSLLLSSLDAVAVIPGQAMSLAMITVVGQCIGARDIPQARRMAKKLMKITYLINGACCLLTIAATPLVLQIYSLSPEAISLGMTLIFIHNGCAALIWPASFTLPNVLRAANDVRYPMICSVASMMLLRLASGYVFAVTFNLGAIGIWIAMVGDWLCRALCFFLRFRGTRWLRLAPGVQAVAESGK